MSVTTVMFGESTKIRISIDGLERTGSTLEEKLYKLQWDHLESPGSESNLNRNPNVQKPVHNMFKCIVIVHNAMGTI